MPKNKRAKHGATKRWTHATGGYSSLKYVSLFVFGVGLLGFATALVLFVQTNNVTFTPLPTITHTTEVPDTGELLNLINEQRRSGNRTELTVDERLKSVAEKRLNDMIASQQYSHKNLEGKYYYDLLSGYGYTAAYSCENLDIEPSVKPIDFIRSWLGSGSGHKECMLSDKVTKIGVASGKFSDDDKTTRDNFLVVVIFAATPLDKSTDR
jgi:uncharacterized protein YkwD